MAKAKKLPSGKWRCLVYSHTENGKRKYESFTASTKAEAEMLAAQFANDNERRRVSDLTVKEAVEQYINANENILSPSTIRGYRMDLKRMAPIHDNRIRKITTASIQTFISGLAKEYSPKTVKNTYALLSSSLTFCGVEKNLMIHLPTIPKRAKEAPENEQIIALYSEASPTMKRAIVLAAFHSLRRGEICALQYKDLKGNKLHVHSDIVRGSGGWIHKETPKTESSNRFIYLSDAEVKIMGSGSPNDYIVPVRPSTIDKNFQTLKKHTGIDIRFHDLRGYFASIAVAMGIPDIYTSHLGGWRENSTVLKEYYQKPIVSINEGYAKKMNDYFENMQHDMQHGQNKRTANTDG